MHLWESRIGLFSSALDNTPMNDTLLTNEAARMPKSLPNTHPGNVCRTFRGKYEKKQTSAAAPSHEKCHLVWPLPSFILVESLILQPMDGEILLAAS